MKSLITPFARIVVLALLCLALPSKAQLSQNPTQPSSPDSDSLVSVDPSLNMALGGGKAGFPNGTDVEIFNIAAHSGPLGVNSRGHVRASCIAANVGFSCDLRGDVTCLTVAGNTATAGGIITELTFNGVPQTTLHGFFVTVQDNKALGVPDTWSDVFLFTSPPTPGTVCPLSFQPNFTVNEGNIVVRGAL